VLQAVDNICLYQKNSEKKRAGNFTSDLDSSPEIHRQVQDVVRYDDRAALFSRALLVEQTNHIATPAHMESIFIITNKHLILSTEELNLAHLAE
jgi:hypothetical protein